MRKLTMLSLMFAAAISVSAADVAISVGGGTGTETDPFIVSTPAHLAEIAAACNAQGTSETANSHFTKKYFKMTSDIDMAGVTDFIGIGTADWPNTGSSSAYYFDGIWDGGGHSIKNLTINGVTFTDAGLAQTSAKNASRNYVGFFGTLGEYAVVKNLHLDASCSISGWSNVGGIAGYLKAKAKTTSGNHQGDLSGTQIINCSNAGTVTGYNQYVGGIAGYASRANAKDVTGKIIVKGCINTGKVITNYGVVGGVIGYASYSDIEECVNLGEVRGDFINASRAETSARTLIGGIVGNSNYSNLSNCANYGKVFVYKNGYYVGSLAGQARRTGSGTAASPYSGSLKNCVALGSVECGDMTRVGMIAGDLGTSATAVPEMSGVYYDAQLYAAMAPGIPGVSKTYVVGDAAKGVFGMTTKEFTAGTALEGLSADLWTVEAGFYPRMKAFDANIKAAAATYMVLPDGVTTENLKGTSKLSTAMSGITAKVADGVTSVVVNGSDVVASAPSALVESYITITNGVYSLDFPFMQIPKYFDGEGTQASPYLIKTKADVLNLMNSVNGTELNHYTGEYFKMTADIDMENDATFVGIGVLPAGGTNAQKTHYFAGIFDGDGHTFKNMKVDQLKFTDKGMQSSTTSAFYAGMFGALEAGGVVKNINFDSSCSFSGYNGTGSAVGYLLTGAKVENITSAANVKGYGYVGGIVGRSMSVTAKDNPDAEVSEISNCLFSGEVLSGANYNGGIVGYNYSILSNSVNTGSVKAYQAFGNGTNFTETGGIAGYNVGNITDCANYGTVYSAGQITATVANGKVGGIAGSTSSTYSRGNVANCFNAGVVTSPKEVATSTGAILGVVPSGLKLGGNAYDNQLSAFGGVANAETDEVKGFATSALTAGTAIEPLGANYTFTAGYYPMPTAWAQNAAVKAAAATYFTLPAGQAINNFQTEGVIATTMPLQATLANPGVFKVENGKVIAGACTEIATDTLTLTNGTFKAVYPLMKLPPVLPGSGTEADPWQIATAADFIKAANYMADAAYTFSGEYVKVLADLDFTGVEFVPMGSQTLAFDGNFDGNGKTFKNIVYEGNDSTQIHHIGLFSTLGTHANVGNFTLTGLKMTGYGYVGGVTSINRGVIHDVELDATCAVTGTRKGTTTATNADGSYVGGIAASAEQGAKFINCVNRAEINTTRYYTGGIVGFVANAANNVVPTALIQNCRNYANVTSTAPKETSGPGAAQAKETRIGGIAGQFAGSIEKTVNEGNVTVLLGKQVGGLIGMAGLATTVTESANKGTIHSLGETGGIIGATNTAIGADTLKAYVSKSFNYGEVIAGTDSLGSDAMYNGGIIGRCYKNWNVYDCGNYGTVRSMVVNATYGHTFGGIIGHVNAGKDNFTEIFRCFNVGEIRATASIGGIVGYTLTGYSKIENCFNAGAIVQVSTDSKGVPQKATINAVSGIAGGYSKITNSYNAGEITAWEAAGMGYALEGTTAENCYNIGRINPINPEALTNFAEIFVNDRNNMAVTNCYGLKDAKLPLENDAKYQVNLIDSVAMLGIADKLGAAYKANAAAFPMLVGLDTVPQAQFAAAWYLLAEGDTPEKITQPITLANLPAVTWTGNSIFTIENGIATPKEKGPATLTKTTGELTETYNFISDAGEPEDITADGINYHLNLETLEATVVAGEYTGVINIPATVESYGKTYIIVGVDANAFFKSTVTELTIGENVKTVGKDGFRNCSKLTKVTTPSLQKWMAIDFANSNANPIYNCGKLFVGDKQITGTLEIPEGTEKIGGAYTFRGLKEVTAVKIPEGVKEIGNGAFNGMTDLKEAIIPESCTTIGTGLFFGCTNLAKITLPATLKTIPDNTFYQCGFTALELPEGIETIGMMAFASCDKLAELTLPSTLKSLGMMALSDASALTKLTTKATTVPEAGQMAFDGIDYSNCTLYVPEGKLDAYKNAAEWSNFTKIEIDLSAIAGIMIDGAADARFYTLDGREVMNPAAGTLVIAVYTDANGKRVAKKLIVRK